MDCLLDLDRREEGRPERPDTSRLSFSKDKYGKYFIISQEFSGLLSPRVDLYWSFNLLYKLS